MRAAVLMSTFNGAEFLGDQIDSILRQSYGDMRLLIRDDGSTDGTRDILARYSSDPRVTIIRGANLGLPHAYFELFSLCPDDADIVFLSDQDDVWHPEKVNAAVVTLAATPPDVPVLYCGRLHLVSSSMTSLGLSRDRIVPARFGNALAENICTGCTAAFNRSLLLLLRRRPSDMTAVAHHDWWMYLVASAFGRVIYDATALIDYRQHAANAVGMPTSIVEGLRRRIGRLMRYESIGIIVRQANAFNELFKNDLPSDVRDCVLRLLSLGGSSITERLQLMVDFRIHRQSLHDDLIWRTLVALSSLRLLVANVFLQKSP